MSTDIIEPIPILREFPTESIFPDSLDSSQQSELHKLTTAPDYDALYLTFISPQVQFGMFTHVCIAKGTHVLSYVGEYINSRECHRRHQLRKPQEGNYILTWREHTVVDNQEVTFISNIDATVHGGIARFLNHSCDPNLDVVILRPKDSLIGIPTFIANRNIFPKEQLCFDYGGVYSSAPATGTAKQAWLQSDLNTGIAIDCEDNASDSSATMMSWTMCMCGSDNCGGFLPAPLS